MKDLEIGTIVVPYRRDKPIVLFANEGDNFIRAQKRDDVEYWFSDVQEQGSVSRPIEPGNMRTLGIVVFLNCQEIRAGQGIRITRVSHGGKSARGVVFELPAIVAYPYDVDCNKLTNPATAKD